MEYADDIFNAKHIKGSSNANEALEISFVQAAPGSPRTLSSFRPQFTYPIFGDEERIFGYQNLKLNLRFAAHDLRPNLEVLYDKKFKPIGDTKATDIEETLKEWSPEGENVPAIFTKEKSGLKKHDSNLRENWDLQFAHSERLICFELQTTRRASRDIYQYRAQFRDMEWRIDGSDGPTTCRKNTDNDFVLHRGRNTIVAGRSRLDTCSMASLLCVRNLHTRSQKLLTKSYKLRKALRPTITKCLPVFHSRLLDFIPLRHLRPQCLIQIFKTRVHSSSSNTNFAGIFTLSCSNISISHPSVSPFPWTRHTPLQRHGQNISRLIHMH